MKLKIIVTAILIFSFSNNFSQTRLRQVFKLKHDISYCSSFKTNYFKVVQTDKISSHNYSFLNLTGQAVAGSGFAVVFSIIPLALTWQAAWKSDGINTREQMALGILTLASYTFGAAVGVHWVAKAENPNISFWGTVGYSAIGDGAAILLASILASQYKTIPGAGGVVIALCPVIGSMVYASFISDWQ